ncbi:MAG: hypothetical protein WDZ31_00880 [Phycisphaeraceae bacterium]
MAFRKWGKLHTFLSSACIGFVLATLGMSLDQWYLCVIGIVIFGGSILLAALFVVVVAVKSRGRRVMIHEVTGEEGT